MIARRLPLLLPASLCAALMLPAGASATVSPAEQHQATEKAVGYVRSVQQSDGSFPGFGGEWTLSALAAAGVAPAGVKSGATDARSFYRSLVGDSATWPGGAPHVTDFENAALAAYAAGIDPARVSPTQNLIAQILARYQPASPGYYGEPGFFNGTAFALMALADTKTRKGAERVPQALLAPSIAVARANQHTDGGWTFFSVAGSQEARESPSEAEFTGATIAALCTSGVPVSDPAIAAARTFLAHDLETDGAFAAEFGPNTDTNAWAVQGLDACGISPQGAEFTTATGKTPLDYLVSQQLAGGGFRFEAAEASPNLYSTQDALRALAGGGFTAEPPKAKGAPRWVYERSFTAGQATSIGLVIDGSGPVSVCSAPVTPASSKTTLRAVLEAAKSASSPSGCVTAFTTGKGGVISAVNGQPGSWTVSADGGKAKKAKLAGAVQIGDTLYLHD
jgi:hypothetical protein